MLWAFAKNRKEALKTKDVPPPAPDEPVVTNIRDLGAFDAVQIGKLIGPSAQAFDLKQFALIITNSGYILLAPFGQMRHALAALQDVLNNNGVQYKRVWATSEVIFAVNDLLSQSATEEVRSDQSSIEQLVTDLFEEACAYGASDIHIETRNTVDVYFRINGFRVLRHTLSRNTGFAIAGVMFDILADNSAKRDVKWSPETPIDAVINHTTRSGTRLQIRFASAPIYPSGSFQVICRLLQMDHKQAMSLHELSYFPWQEQLIERMLFGTHGLVLIVGPTNSGKSTTMQALARRIADIHGAGIKIETIEDPVEYIIDNACQMPVSSRADFSSLLKSTMRHDPDVLMVGEIRDRDSAETIKNIVLAGRKVLSTLHAYESLAAFQRLQNIGVPADVLYMNGFISGVIYQRLLPKLCPNCSVPYEYGVERGWLSEGLMHRLDRAVILSDGNIRLRNPEGCPSCRGGTPGISGRVVCAEIVTGMTDVIEALREGNYLKAKMLWLKGSPRGKYGPTVLDHALEIMMQGCVDPRDIERQIDAIHRSDIGEIHDTGINEPNSYFLRSIRKEKC